MAAPPVFLGIPVLQGHPGLTSRARSCPPRSQYCAGNIAFDCPTDSVCRGLAPCAIREPAAHPGACCALPHARLPAKRCQLPPEWPPSAVGWHVQPAPARPARPAGCPPAFCLHPDTCRPNALPLLAAAEPDETCSEGDFTCLDHRCAPQRPPPAQLAAAGTAQARSARGERHLRSARSQSAPQQHLR